MDRPLWWGPPAPQPQADGDDGRDFDAPAFSFAPRTLAVYQWEPPLSLQLRGGQPKESDNAR